MNISTVILYLRHLDSHVKPKIASTPASLIKLKKELACENKRGIQYYILADERSQRNEQLKCLTTSCASSFHASHKLLFPDYC
jgi:hypothetical protein